MIHEVEPEHLWLKAQAWFRKLSGGKPVDLNGALLLIGIQELGQGIRNFSKEEKQDLMHIGTCKVLSTAGYYKLEGLDSDGWPHWVPDKDLPVLSLKEQEILLKLQVVEYLRTELGETL